MVATFDILNESGEVEGSMTMILRAWQAIPDFPGRIFGHKNQEHRRVILKMIPLMWSA
ncbi:MAG: hypothetical protein U5N58_01755 [Actinomycetota bacterium]|nr:hypothetical protein [Actinomycetota bacterium]